MRSVYRCSFGEGVKYNYICYLLFISVVITTVIIAIIIIEVSTLIIILPASSAKILKWVVLVQFSRKRFYTTHFQSMLICKFYVTLIIWYCFVYCYILMLYLFAIK